MSYRAPLTVKAEELNQMRNRGLVMIKYADMELEGTIGEIILAGNDAREFGSFDFHLTDECKQKYPDVEIPTNFSAFEIEGIKSSR